VAKQGKSITELAAELERQRDSKKDYLAPVAALTLQAFVRAVEVRGLNGSSYPLTPYAHGQVAEYVGIPKAYYDRTLAAHPALLADSVNTWLGDKADDKRLVRTLDGNVRAWLSNRYRPLDNADLAEAILPTLVERKVEIISSEITETRFYIKGILPDLSDTIADGLQWGSGHTAVAPQFRSVDQRRESKIVAAITITNSEVGAGSLKVEPSVFTTWCTNLAVIAQAAMRKYHVGRGFDLAEDFSIFTDKTRQADDLAFWLKVKDTVGAAFAEDQFRAAIASIRQAAETRIESDDLPKVVEVATTRLALPEGLRSPILTALAQGGDFSKWGLAQAVTNVANRVADYDLATDLEHVGGKIIDLGDKDWKVISQAA